MVPLKVGIIYMMVGEMFKRQHIYKWQGPEQTYSFTICTQSTHPLFNRL